MGDIVIDLTLFVWGDMGDLGDLLSLLLKNSLYAQIPPQYVGDVGAHKAKIHRTILYRCELADLIGDGKCPSLLYLKPHVSRL